MWILYRSRSSYGGTRALMVMLPDYPNEFLISLWRLTTLAGMSKSIGGKSSRNAD
jgi:hypothetical protein